MANCEQTINRLLNTEEAYNSIAHYITITRLKSICGGKKKKGFMTRAADKFKGYKEEKAEQFSGAKHKKGKISTGDPMERDKQFLSKLAEIESPEFFDETRIRKFKGRKISQEASEVLEFLNNRDSFWSQLNI